MPRLTPWSPPAGPSRQPYRPMDDWSARAMCEHYAVAGAMLVAVVGGGLMTGGIYALRPMSMAQIVYVASGLVVLVGGLAAIYTIHKHIQDNAGGWMLPDLWVASHLPGGVRRYLQARRPELDDWSRGHVPAHASWDREAHLVGRLADRHPRLRPFLLAAARAHVHGAGEALIAHVERTVPREQAATVISEFLLDADQRLATAAAQALARCAAGSQHDGGQIP